MRRQAGFTLVEMLVVIAIITILAALVVVLISGVIDRARNEARAGLVKSLDQVSHGYHTEFKVWPPSTPYSESQNLHFYLGRNWTQVKTWNNDGTPAITTAAKPFREFKRRELEGNPASAYPNPPRKIIDSYGRPLRYTNPGVKVASAVDIWSEGKDMITDPSLGGGDDIGNWIRDK